MKLGASCHGATTAADDAVEFMDHSGRQVVVAEIPEQIYHLAKGVWRVVDQARHMKGT
jgi:flavin-binding protein dodecin